MKYEQYVRGKKKQTNLADPLVLRVSLTVVKQRPVVAKLGT